VAVPRRCHGWWPAGSGCNAPISSTGERTVPRLSRHATSSVTLAFRKPSCGATRNQLTPGAAADVVAGLAASTGGPGTELGSPGLGAAEQATATTPKQTTKTLIRTLMPTQHASDGRATLAATQPVTATVHAAAGRQSRAPRTVRHRVLVPDCTYPGRITAVRPQNAENTTSAEHAGDGSDVGGAFVFVIVARVGFVGAVEDAHLA
jgi:hypothetical protein